MTDNKVVFPQPDYYEGHRPGKGNRRIRKELNNLIVPTAREELPFAPNNFVEAKGPEGAFVVAERQAAYEGAAGARGMHALHSIGRPKYIYDGNAYTTSSIVHGSGNLDIHTHHITQPRGPGTEPAYHMRPIGNYSLRNSYEDWRQGLTAFRNLQEHAEEIRTREIEDANRRMKHVTSPEPGLGLESDSSSLESSSEDDNVNEHSTKARRPLKYVHVKPKSSSRPKSRPAPKSHSKSAPNASSRKRIVDTEINPRNLRPRRGGRR